MKYLDEFQDPALVYGPLDQDHRHRFTASWVWDLPGQKLNGPARWVIGGFAIFGSQVLLVGIAPADLARRGTAAAAAGFVNFMGYMGAFSGDLVTGYLRHHYNWQSAIYFWAVCALVAALVVATLWRVGPRAEVAITGE